MSRFNGRMKRIAAYVILIAMVIGCASSSRTIAVYADEPFLTRAELTQTLADLIGVPFDERMTGVAVLGDVDPDSDAYESIVICCYLRIIYEYAGGYFDPERVVTRADLAAILCNAAKLDVGSSSYDSAPGDVFDDIWYYPYVCAALENGLISVKGDGLFHPDDHALPSDINSAIENAVYKWVDTIFADMDVQNEISEAKTLGGYPFALDEEGEIDPTSFIVVSDQGACSLSGISEDNVVTIYRNRDGNIFRIEVGTKIVSGLVTNVENSAKNASVAIEGKNYGLNRFSAIPADEYINLMDNAGEGIFYLDYNGNIFWCDAVENADSDFLFDLSAGTITGYTGNDSVVAFPSKIGGVPVTVISLLGRQPDIKKIVISASVEEIATNAFGLCWNLESIQVDEQNPAFTSCDGVLFSKDRKTLVRFPRGKSGEYTVPGWVELIGEEAFCDAFDVGPIVILSGVTTICSGAFNNTEMTEITLPKTLTTIEDGAFIYVEDLTDVYFTGSKADWAKIAIGSDNEALLNANIHYNAAEPAELTDTYTLAAASGKSVEVTFSRDWGTISVSGDVSADTPVLVTSYDNSGRFLGLSVITSPSVKASPEEAAETVKILWMDADGCEPLSGAEEVNIS